MLAHFMGTPAAHSLSTFAWVIQNRHFRFSTVRLDDDAQRHACSLLQQRIGDVVDCEAVNHEVMAAFFAN